MIKRLEKAQRAAETCLDNRSDCTEVFFLMAQKRDTDAADSEEAGSIQGQGFQLSFCHLICFPLHLVSFI